MIGDTLLGEYCKLDSLDIELLAHVCLPDKITSSKLSISADTIRKRVERLKLKFGVENRASLVVKAVKLGLVPISALQYRELDGQNILRETNCRNG